MADSEQKYLAFVIQQAFIFHLEYIVSLVPLWIIALNEYMVSLAPPWIVARNETSQLHKSAKYTPCMPVQKTYLMIGLRLWNACWNIDHNKHIYAHKCFIYKCLCI